MHTSRRSAVTMIALAAALGAVALAGHAEGRPGGYQVADAQVNATSETRLRTAIGYLASGTPDYADMEPMLRIAVEQQMPMITARLRALGPLRKLEFVGPQAGSDVFRATFENGVTSWAIQISPSGKLSTLFFQ